MDHNSPKDGTNEHLKPQMDDSDSKSDSGQKRSPSQGINGNDNVSVIRALLQLHQQQQGKQDGMLHQQQQLLLQQWKQQQQQEDGDIHEQQLQSPAMSNDQTAKSQVSHDNGSCCTSSTENTMKESETELRYMNTMQVLEEAGLLDIALKTSELTKQNQALQRDLDTLEYIVRSTSDLVETE